ncbi:type II secretion system F family protein [Paenibacillus macquariensis]|uniref:Type II secretion system protein GspF domain-containing protein n=1 Tax=Paenibacillus macquariensis TaxID=948756 RepID=A0ABY1KI11_9BACL|nr:hypothetical protein [Paenibacillus macquariensis]OAB30517.1 hypothetical protein PMSM_22760 [Paenibacillus macquariensis subsp. macquariensis]SIR71208.1 hypothetical protein SAMN05421578_14011 [Paenibacillus macquariensis]
MSVYLYAILPVIWIIALNVALPKIENTNIYKKKSEKLSGFLGYQKIHKDAADAGVQLNKKEFILITLGSIAIGIIITIVLKNYFFLAVGMTLSYMLPRYFVSKLKRNRRQKILFELPGNLKLLTSKLIDFPSVQSALEQSVNDMHGETKTFFEEMLADLKTGFSVESALIEMKRKTCIKRFDDFAEKLLMADEQGFHDRSIHSLKETGRDMTADNLVLKEMQIKAKKDMRNLYIVTILSWAMPTVLSSVNTNNSNVFLDTQYGQIYIVFFVLVTLYSIIKAEDFVSLNLDEI